MDEDGNRIPIPDDKPGHTANDAIDDLIDKAKVVQADEDYEAGATAAIVAKDRANDAKKDFTDAEISFEKKSMLKEKK